MNFTGTQTEKNLRSALAGESIARNKYTYFAAKAREEGNDDTAALFEKLAENEKEHAKLWYKMLYNGIQATEENLQAAMKGENEEWLSMYPEFAKTAREEGFETLAIMFEKVAGIEQNHEKRFMQEFIRIKNTGSDEYDDTLQNAQPVYRCQFCGHIETGEQAPVVCPVCQAIGAFEKAKA